MRAKTLVCEHCGNSVPVESFRMVTSCPHCGVALGSQAASACGASKVLYCLDVILRLVAGVGVAAVGVWLLCTALWNPTWYNHFWREHRGVMVVVAAGLVLVGGFAALRESVRLRRLRRGASGSDGSETTSQG